MCPVSPHAGGTEEVETEQELLRDYPATPAGVQTAPEEVCHALLVTTETTLLPDGGSCETTATSPTGRTDEEERRTAGVRGTREEARPGGEGLHPDRELTVVMT